MEFSCEVGRAYMTSGQGTLKRGVMRTVVERYRQNGYNYYRDHQNTVHHEGDLTDVVETELR